jgi:hypothetical protein
MSKQIPGFNRYTISETGIIHDIKLGRELKPYQEENGYLRVSLTCDDKKQKKMFHHRLMALTFIPNPDNLPVIDHINQIKTDNRIENLRWVSFVENSQNYERANVYWCESKGKFIARRMINTKLIHIGSFDDIEDAIEAVKKFKEDGTKAKTPSSSTGHKNVYLANGGKSYYVNMVVQGQRHIKRGFLTVEEAIDYRDNFHADGE